VSLDAFVDSTDTGLRLEGESLRVNEQNQRILLCHVPVILVNAAKIRGYASQSVSFFEQVNAAEYANFALDLKCSPSLNCGRLGSI
jgi:hypothetical protein